jgi:uncharacterized RDD family membrane protein YckC
MHTEKPALQNIDTAPLLRRSIAAVADLLIIAIPFGGLNINEAGLPIPTNILFSGLPGLAVTIAAIISYWIIMEWLAGATLGKLMFGLRVISDDGQECTFKQSLIRNLLRFGVDILGGYLVAFIAALYDDNRKRIGDTVAGTIVVTSKTARRIFAQTSESIQPSSEPH